MNSILYYKLILVFITVYKHFLLHMACYIEGALRRTGVVSKSWLLLRDTKNDFIL